MRWVLFLAAFAFTAPAFAQVPQDPDAVLVLQELSAYGDTTRPEVLAAVTDPKTSVDEHTARVEWAIAGLEKKSPAKARTLREGFAKVKDATAKVLERELACRADDACMVTRAVCGELAHKKELQALLAEEKANPAGVIDLRRAYELGNDIQITDKRIAEAKATYAKVVKKPFADKACR